MFDASNYWITVVECPSYEEAIDGLLTLEEADGLIAYIAKHPDEGVVIPDTGGLRKIRWPACGDRSRKIWVVYYFRDLNMPAYLVAAFGKGETLRLTKAEKAALRSAVEELVAQQWQSQVSPLISAQLRPSA